MAGVAITTSPIQLGKNTAIFKRSPLLAVNHEWCGRGPRGFVRLSPRNAQASAKDAWLLILYHSPTHHSPPHQFSGRPQPIQQSRGREPFAERGQVDAASIGLDEIGADNCL